MKKLPNPEQRNPCHARDRVVTAAAAAAAAAAGSPALSGAVASGGPRNNMVQGVAVGTPAWDCC